jgi:hypothetical protein
MKSSAGTMATPPSQVFTLEAVNSMIPRLNRLVGEQLVRRAEIETRLKELSEKLGSTPETLSPEAGDPPEALALKRELATRVETYQAAWRELEDMGAVLKDARIGLVDFYGRVDGKLVWLCWKYGENEVSHYHALDEGFSGRKEIPSSMKLRLLN